MKMLFFYKIFTFSRLFSHHPNKFYYKKFQNHSQHHTPPKLQFNPRQQTLAIKSHNHQNTTTTPPHNNNKNQNHRERSVGRMRDQAEASSSGARSKARSIVRLKRAIWASSRSSNQIVRSGLPLDCRTVACDRRTRKRRSRLRWRHRRRDLASSRARALALSLSPSLSTRLTRKWFEVKI